MVKQVVIGVVLALWFFFNIGAETSGWFEGLEIVPESYLINRIPYVRCNEAMQPELFLCMREFQPPENGVHIGWSIELNYKLIIERKPKLAFLCDINRRVFEFYDSFKKSVLNAESSEEALSLLESELSQQVDYFFSGMNPRRRMKVALKTFASWLMPEENFHLLKQMYLEERICHMVLSACDDSHRFAIMAQWIEDHGYRVDTVYISNICGWLKDRQQFKNNLTYLVDEDTLLIDSHAKLSLRLTRGGFPPF